MLKVTRWPLQVKRIRKIIIIITNVKLLHGGKCQSTRCVRYLRNNQWLLSNRNIHIRWWHIIIFLTICTSSYTLVTSIVETTASRNIHLYRLSNLIASNDQISVGNIFPCIHYGCLESRNILVWMTIGMLLYYATYIIGHSVNI